MWTIEIDRTFQGQIEDRLSEHLRHQGRRSPGDEQRQDRLLIRKLDDYGSAKPDGVARHPLRSGTRVETLNQRWALALGKLFS